MKPQSHRTSNASRIADSTPGENDSVRTPGMPYFPSLRRDRRTIDQRTVPESTNESDPSSSFSVRAFALLAIGAIIATLVAMA